MPSQRSKDQRLLNIAVKESFLVQVDEALAALKIPNRSEFVRLAILEKLTRLGVEIPEELGLPPMRAGKGGRRRLRPSVVKYPDHTKQVALVAERADSISTGQIKEHAVITEMKALKNPSSSK